MTAVTAPRSRRSLLGVLLTAVLAHFRPRGGSQRVADLVAAARKHVLTVAMLASMDLGGFQVFHHGGWFVLAASVALLDFAVTG